MFMTHRVTFATIAFFGFSTVFAMQEQPRLPIDPQIPQQVVQDRWLNPQRRIATSWNVPALVAAVSVGTATSFINWVTLRGNMWTMRRDMSKINRNVSNYLVADVDRLIKFDLDAFKKTIENDAASLARHKQFSMVRRTMPFKALVFGLPAYATYRFIAQNETLKAMLCGALAQAEDALG